MSRFQKIAEVEQWIANAESVRWETDQIQDRFQKVNAPNYGDSMPRWVPDHDETRQLFLDALAPHATAGADLLDLGAGTGRDALTVFEAFADIQLHLVDFSDNMMSVIPERLSAFEGRFTMQVSDMYADSLDFAPASFDAIFSTFAICHGQSVEEYVSLYERIHRWLKPGGLFITFDHICGANRRNTALNALGWYEHMTERGGFSAETTQEAVTSTYEEDNPLSLAQHMQLLTDAGFADADVLFKKYIFAIYSARKV